MNEGNHTFKQNIIFHVVIYCKILACQLIGSLVCRLRNYAKKRIFRSLSVRSCHSTASPFLKFWKFNFWKISVFLFSIFSSINNHPRAAYFVVINYARAVYV